ncbi:unnamed protein product [Heligmosomoides polygyrus]|uniref:NR LBD domain-containing protein n=1 Tax=Heligmosomoides polygyrus TaxID=6339 RepID=A0A183FTP8_HELPZ|nr:unnamed protein product [Heligmosomoides polygyrus]
MSRKGKRRKLPQDDEADSDPSINVTTIADNVRTANELFCFHEYVLLEWMDGRDDEDTRSMIRLLKGLCDLLNHRWNTSTKRSILLEFSRCMLKHGVPFHYVWGSHTSKFMAREEYCGKFSPTNNVDLFFRDLSLLEHRIRSSIWNFHNVYFGCTKTTTRVLGTLNGANISTLRDLLCLATRNLNYRAIVAKLANSEILRMTSEIIEKAREGVGLLTYNIQHLIYFDSPMTIWIALQATLSMKHDLSFNMGNRLLLLATMQSMIYTTTAARNTILMQLSEFLIVAILCGTPGDVSGIVALENSINRFNKSYEASSLMIFTIQ